MKTHTLLSQLVGIGILITICGCTSHHQPTKSKEDLEKLHAFAKRIPKAELAVHLEGSIAPATLLKLAQKNNIKLPATTVEELNKMFAFTNFDNFLKTYLLVTSCLKTPEDYTFITYEFGKECVRHNIHYAEVTFTITSNCEFSGLSATEIIAALNKGKEQVKKEFGITINWIFDFMRNKPETAQSTLDAILEAQSHHEGITALGISGDENAKVSPATFASVIEKAVKNEVPITVHAGEWGKAETVWSALKDYKAKRIEHGLKIYDDPKLVTYLKENQIPIDAHLSSNICLKVVNKLQNHPLHRMWKDGLLITMNTDDPALFNTDLTREYYLLVDHFNFDVEDLERISLNGVTASFLPTAEKEKLHEEFKKEIDTIKKEIWGN